MKGATFAQRVVDWASVHGRHNLPWQTDRSPYRVWVSEVMLQQTQVTTVIPYFERFMARFPNVTALGTANVDRGSPPLEWLGLLLTRTQLTPGQQVVDRFGGHFPTDFDDIQSLPGVGRSTAGAIASMALGQCQPILDGNVKRVLARHEAIDKMARPKRDTQPAVGSRGVVYAVGERRALRPRHDGPGATLCRNPTCLVCPVMEDCKARAQGDPERFPSPRPKNERPLRHSGFVVLRDSEGKVLLKRRPPTGVWNRLWSISEALDESVSRHCLLHHGLKPAASITRLDDISMDLHTFSSINRLTSQTYPPRPNRWALRTTTTSCGCTEHAGRSGPRRSGR